MIRDLIRSAYYPSEIKAMLKLKLGVTDKDSHVIFNTDYAYAYDTLDKVSRSFAAVIRQLPDELRDPVCIFYLVLRGLDSVEDDPDLEPAYKAELLKNFHHNLANPNFNLPGVGDTPHYKELMGNFDKIVRCYQNLDKPFQLVISDITEKMADGMAKYANFRPDTIEDWDEYCYYVAGLVGIGLSALFSASGREHYWLKNEEKLSNSMGLFLQKTNIIRDYFEDYPQGRVFWPQSVWSKYASDFGWFQANPNQLNATSCINELVTDALRHIPDCLEYLSLLKDEKNFKFCAIPQVMAIATLTKIYANPEIFNENVKIRKGLAASLMVNTNSLEDVMVFFKQCAQQILWKANPADPNYRITKRRIEKILELTSAPKEQISKLNNEYKISY